MSVELQDEQTKIESLPDLETSSRPQEEIEVGILPLPAGVKAWLYRVLTNRPAEPPTGPSKSPQASAPTPHV